MPNQQWTGTGWHSWAVPNNVDRVTVDVQGGGSPGHGSGRVTGVLLVNDKQTLWVFIGGAGKANSGSTGGAGGTGNGVRGGNGHAGFNGGDGGGGASYIRLNSKTGTIKAVAGGAGGDSGDSGDGGDGGANVGESGHRGTSGSNPTGVATGGTQTQGGNGGTNSNGAQYNGNDALNGALSSGGVGGEANSGVACHGGGGGGGGWRGGGGGQASAPSYAPGGGGGGGSNYIGGLTQVSVNSQGGGGTGDGQVTVTWVSPPPANQPPSPPSGVKLNGIDVSNGMQTRITGSPTIKATISDPDKNDVRLALYWSTSSDFSNSHGPRYGDYVAWKSGGASASVDMPDLAQDTHYYVRLYTEDKPGKKSTNYNGFDFYTNQTAIPDSLKVNGGSSGVTINTIDSATFSWQFNDPDQGDLQKGFQLQYRTAATTTASVGAWTLIDQPNTADNMSPGQGPPAHSNNQWVFNPGTFKGNTFYDWQVRTTDLAGLRSDWSLISRFYAMSVSTPPILVGPVKDVAQDVNKNVTFTWNFRDPDPGDSQTRADLRYRVIGSADPADQSGGWTTVLGDSTTPGSTGSLTVQGTNFLIGQNYEWQVRTYDTSNNASDWSDSGTFWSIGTPGSAGVPDVVPDQTTPQDTLGCGLYTAYVYEQGGMHLLGEVTPMLSLNFARVRDDISNCVIVTNGLGDCCDFYGTLRCWMHELVIFRDNVRVWEGPITRIGYSVDSVEIEARDVMMYLYRRIMRQGYNDTFQIIERAPNGQILSSAPKRSVVERAALIATNALAPFDPNVLPYLTAITGTADASSHAFVDDWSTTAWEQIDSLAATGGLDYTVVGRRIIMWDTHVAIGKLPALTDGDFTDSPIVTEYGMNLATFMGVTNGSGVAGTAQVDNPNRPHGQPVYYPYGPVEMLASSYSQSATDSTDALTPDAIAALVEDMTSQAVANLADRFPPPLIVRIPDNSTLSPKANIGFQQLVPGVWIPLRASGTCRVVTQWQKLDSVSVSVDEQGENITVVLSPAPRGGQDPDLGDGSDDSTS